MAQIRGTAGYHLGGNNLYGGLNTNRNDATDDPSPLDAIREQTSKIEDWLDTVSDPVKPYVRSPLISSAIAFYLGVHAQCASNH
jgi:hypothetical protein